MSELSSERRRFRDRYHAAFGPGPASGGVRGQLALEIARRVALFADPQIQVDEHAHQGHVGHRDDRRDRRGDAADRVVVAERRRQHAAHEGVQDGGDDDGPEDVPAEPADQGPGAAERLASAFVLDHQRRDPAGEEREHDEPRDDQQDEADGDRQGREHTHEHDRPEPGEPVPVALADLQISAEERPGGGAGDGTREDRPHQDRESRQDQPGEHAGDEASVDDDLHAVPELLLREALADPELAEEHLRDRERDHDHGHDHEEVLPVAGIEPERVAEDLADAAWAQQAGAARLFGDAWLHDEGGV